MRIASFTVTKNDDASAACPVSSVTGYYNIDFLACEIQQCSSNVTLQEVFCIHTLTLNSTTGLTRDKCILALQAGLKPEVFNVPNYECT